MCSCVCACEQIARTRSGDKGFKNVPAPARQTPPINPENFTFRFPKDKKWVIQNSCPKRDRSFFGKKGQHFLDSIRSGLSEIRNGDQKVQKYLFSKIFYGQQEVHKYLSYPEIFLFFS